MRSAPLSSRLLCSIAIAAFSGLAPADTATPRHARTHGHVHHTNVVASRVPSNVFYLPTANIGYPHSTLALNRPAQGRRLFGVPPLVDPSAGVIDRSAWSWRPMRLGIAQAFPAYASDIRVIESPAVALDGATFLADDVVYRLRGFNAPPLGTPGADAARKRLDVVLASGERIVVYPVGLDHEQRMLADAVVGSGDLIALLRDQ